MPVVIANTTQGNANPSSTSGDHDITVNRSAGEGFVVGVFYEYEFGTPNSITAVIWDPAGDNQTLTQIPTGSPNQLHSDNRYIAAYYLPQPTSVKSATLRVDYSGTLNNVSAIICRHITGHDTADMVRGSASARSSDPVNLDYPITISSAVDDLVIGFMATRLEAEFLSAGDTSNYVEQPANVTSRTLVSGTKAGASSVTMTFGHDTASSFGNALLAVSIKPAAGGGTSPKFGKLTGSVLLNSSLVR